jgi:hypothetical protein
MLPLLAVGAGLVVGGKIMSDMSEAKRLSEEAQKIADEGNSYLEEAEEYQKNIERNLREIQSNLKETKLNGFKTLLTNYIYFKDLDLSLGKYEKYKKSLEEEISKNGLSITLNDILFLNKDIKTITHNLGINLEKFAFNQNELVDDVGIETFAGMTAHGIMAAGVGGIAALAGMEFLTATGVGAILLAPIMLSVSGDKLDDAKKAKLKAEQFRDEARVEKEKWKSLDSTISMVWLAVDTYCKFIDKTVNISNHWIEKYKSNSNDRIAIIKNLITLAYLNKFLSKYPSITSEEMGDFDRLIEWAKDNAINEWIQFSDLQEEIRKIKEG